MNWKERYRNRDYQDATISFVINPVHTWECQLFGAKSGILLSTTKEDAPCWFWRKMQYLIFGNRWRKTK